VLTDYPDLRKMRVSLRRALEEQSLAPGVEFDDVAEQMAIAATELASNTLKHARCPAVVTLSRSRKGFLLDVADDQPYFSPRTADDLAHGHGGRGLRIVQELAIDAGWYVTGEAKHVWAQFRAPRRSRRPQAPRIPVFDLARFIRLFRRIGG
jgi:two-component sensor histidine kinase